MLTPLIIAAALQTSPAVAPGFNCRRARTLVEQSICRDTYLAAADRAVNRLYPRAANGRNGTEARREQRSWLQRRDRCRDRACLKEAYDDQIGELGRLSGRWSQHYRRSGRDTGTLDIEPLGGNWYAFSFYADWVGNAATGNVNTGGAGGVFQLQRGVGSYVTARRDYAGSMTCALRLRPMQGAWRVEEPRGCFGGLNVSLAGLYRRR